MIPSKAKRNDAGNDDDRRPSRPSLMALSAWQLATNDQQQDTKLSYSASSNRHATPIGNAPVSVLSKKDSKNLSNGYAMGRFLADDKDHLSFWISDGGSQSDKSLKHASTRKEPT